MLFQELWEAIESLCLLSAFFPDPVPKKERMDEFIWNQPYILLGPVPKAMTLGVQVTTAAHLLSPGVLWLLVVPWATCWPWSSCPAPPCAPPRREQTWARQPAVGLKRVPGRVTQSCLQHTDATPSTLENINYTFFTLKTLWQDGPRKTW